eukprot:CAMPEP_0172639794 /NCGR_PEP_ID=MMETSP1068-20121228/219932_1 /TAXON_ID=35684 /ORGANISM="Pseudopedinella elastica, Strain CCMP716" /LENGTH=40 /DNA_ID= /DNA_START= /DNA_END= /DNA_ORIENTATION=
MVSVDSDFPKSSCAFAHSGVACLNGKGEGRCLNFDLVAVV